MWLLGVDMRSFYCIMKNSFALNNYSFCYMPSLSNTLKNWIILCLRERVHEWKMKNTLCLNLFHSLFNVIFVSLFFHSFKSCSSADGCGASRAVMWGLSYRAALPGHRCHYDRERQLWAHRWQDLWLGPRSNGEYSLLSAWCLQDYGPQVERYIHMLCALLLSHRLY